MRSSIAAGRGRVGGAARARVPAAFMLGAALAVAAAAAMARAQDRRAQWNAPQDAVRVFGNTYYVGPRGVSSILLTSAHGHVLIDGGLPESVPIIVANVRALGFRLEDVRLILNSHVHYDHAGGIGELQRLSGAAVAATAASARVLESGRSGPDDPQYGALPEIARVPKVQIVSDGQTLRVGPLAVTAHRTGGHTPGGTSWTWRSCEDDRCVDLVYADSLTPVSADGFAFSTSRDYPAALRDFDRSFSLLERISCDVLLTPHPEASGLWHRIARRERGERDAVIDREACRRYAASARRALQARLASERRSPQPRPAALPGERPCS